jgi:type II secretory pathway pseudopilin PulG
LVELLVVIAIIGVLIALLLPAVQAAREAARRIQCSNHLKQLSLACHNYHDVHQCFPPGKIQYSTNPTAAWNAADVYGSWGIAILPFIEQGTLYETMDQTLPNSMGTINTPARVAYSAATDTVLATQMCPSDPSASIKHLVPASGTSTTRNFALGSYSALEGRALRHVNGTKGTGCFDSPTGFSDLPNLWKGILHVVGSNMIASEGSASGYYEGRTRSFNCEMFSGIIDGTSNTYMIVEKHLLNTSNQRSNFWGYSFANYNSSMAYPYSASLKAYRHDICTGSAASGGAGLDAQTCYRGAGAYHTGGFNVGVGDGSVTFVTEVMNVDVWVVFAAIGDGGVLALP